MPIERPSVADAPGHAEPSLDEAVGLLLAAADPHRLALLRALTAGPTCVCELQVQVPLPGNRLSYHLKVLREAGLIAGSKRGRWIDYTLVDGALDRLRAAVPRLPERDGRRAPQPDGTRVPQTAAAGSAKCLS